MCLKGLSSVLVEVHSFTEFIVSAQRCFQTHWFHKFSCYIRTEEFFFKKKKLSKGIPIWRKVEHDSFPNLHTVPTSFWVFSFIPVELTYLLIGHNRQKSVLFSPMESFQESMGACVNFLLMSFFFFCGIICRTESHCQWCEVRFSCEHSPTLSSP